jgi:hypothetical protein
MKNVRVIRLQTGEDVIADLEEGSEQHTLKKAFVIIPMQSKPGQPVQLMMTPYMPYSADDEVVVAKDKVVTIVKPKKDILNSYEQNTSSILTPQNKGLITETTLPSK